MLLSRLPQESWTQTALRDSPSHEMAAPASGAEQVFGPWALENYQLAELRDAMRRLEYVAGLAGNLTPKPTPPDPTPRPGLRRAAPKQTPSNVVYLNSLRAKGA